MSCDMRRRVSKRVITKRRNSLRLNTCSSALQGLLHLQHALHRQPVGGHRYQQAVAGEDGVEAEHTEDRAAVDDDGAPGVEVLPDDAGVEPVQHLRTFAVLGVDLGQLDVRGNDRPAAQALP